MYMFLAVSLTSGSNRDIIKLFSPFRQVAGRDAYGQSRHFLPQADGQAAVHHPTGNVGVLLTAKKLRITRRPGRARWCGRRGYREGKGLPVKDEGGLRVSYGRVDCHYHTTFLLVPWSITVSNFSICVFTIHLHFCSVKVIIKLKININNNLSTT